MKQKLYLLESQGFYKIGVTDNVARRLKNLQTGNPLKINLVAVCEFPMAQELENSLHRLLKALRVKGEWFRLETNQVELLKSTYAAINKGNMAYLRSITGSWKDVIKKINSQ